MTEESRGVSVVDAASLVVGAAVAAVHLRDVAIDRIQLGGWILVWLTFLGIAVSAAGPALFLVRRYVRRTSGYPGLGDILWAILGIPWIFSAFLLPDAMRSWQGSSPAPHATAYTATLWSLLGLAALIVQGLVWQRWIQATREEADARIGPGWTSRVGLLLAVGWPIQLGMGLIVAG